MRINAERIEFGAAFGTSVFLFAVLFAVFFCRTLSEARRDADATGLRARENAPSFYWSEQARRDAAFAPFNAAPTQNAATRLLFEYFLDVENAAEKRDFSDETRNFYRTTLTDARTRFQADADAQERRRRDVDDAVSARSAAQILQTWNVDGKNEIDAELDAATAFLNEFQDVSNKSNASNKSNDSDFAGLSSADAVAQTTLAPFASASELEKSADFRDAAVWLNPKKLRAAPVSVEAAARVAAPKTLGVWRALYWLCVLPGTLFGRFFGADETLLFLVIAKARLRIVEKPRLTLAVSPVFLAESLGSTQTLAALSSVRLLR